MYTDKKEKTKAQKILALQNETRDLAKKAKAIGLTEEVKVLVEAMKIMQMNLIAEAKKQVEREMLAATQMSFLEEAE